MARTIYIWSIQEIGRDALQKGDVCVREIDISRSGNPWTWWSVIFRPTTGEIFKIYCWDGSAGGYSPDLPAGDLPEDITILE